MDNENEYAKELLNQQSILIEEAINKIKAGKHGRTNIVHKMRELVAGPKKQLQEAHAVKDSQTGKKVVSSNEIKRVNLEHCLNVLKNNVPNPESEDLLKFHSDLHDIMMNETTDQDTNITEEEFNFVVSKFKKKAKRFTTC